MRKNKLNHIENIRYFFTSIGNFISTFMTDKKSTKNSMTMHNADSFDNGVSLFAT